MAVTAVFFVHGLVFASWTAHIPHVKATLGLSNGTLGFALLGAPVGAISAMLLAGSLVPRWGSRRVVQGSLIGYCVAGPLVGLAGSVTGLFAALLVWGAFQGTLNVAMNTQAITIERAEKRVLMTGIHAGWSVGSFTGAGIGAIGVGLGVALGPQLLLLATLSLLGVGMLTLRLLPEGSWAERAGSDALPGVPARVSRWSGGIVLLGAIAFASMLCEGATADWSAVYLSDSLRATGVVPGLGYAAFSLVMVSVRLSGNRLLTRFEAHRLLPALAAVAAVGFGAALLVDDPAAALVGFGFLGLGLAAIVPTVSSGAGRIPGMHPGAAVATVSTCGWAGYLVGPPTIGQLASLTSLPVALGLLPLLTAFIVVGTASAPALRVTPAR